MTEPTTHATTDSITVPGPVTTDSTTSGPTGHTRGELAVNREAQDPARGHLPLTVWLTAADTETIATCKAGCCHPVSGPLARHLIAACTRMGETVIHLGASDHQVVSAALTAGCLPVAVFTDPGRAGVSWTRLARTHPDYDLQVTDLRVTDLHVRDPHDDDDEEAPPLLADLAHGAALVVSEQSCDQPSPRHGCSDDDAQVYDIVSAAGLVKPGGHLAVVTGLLHHGAVVDPLPEIIALARQAGLVYLQHIIALRQPARADHVESGHSHRDLARRQQLPGCAGLPASARAHSDVLLFSRARTSLPSAPPRTPTADALDEPTDTTRTQIGGER
ncbi:hypothetical protein [Nonomuraea typhae]|uniref:hypothetical protein n=1 Tax=Nonomuraea typhae TaxID=2603600 RepID=UPI0012F716CE|nr:hypothetical protein [Nonomuraea typhae]